MKIPAEIQKPLMVAAGVGAGVLVLAWLAKRGASAVLDVNAGTPYAGAGIVGTLGNGVDALSGRTLSSAGSSLGTWFFDATHPDEKYLFMTPAQVQADAALRRYGVQTALQGQGVMGAVGAALYNWWAGAPEK